MLETLLDLLTFDSTLFIGLLWILDFLSAVSELTFYHGLFAIPLNILTLSSPMRFSKSDLTNLHFKLTRQFLYIKLQSDVSTWLPACQRGLDCPLLPKAS